MTFAGFTLAGVAGGRYLKNQILPYESYYLGSDFRKRHEVFRRSVCGMCPAGCGIAVRLVDDLPVKLEGNPDCPISRGKLCPKGQMGLELHYNPDRIVAPLKRVGPPGSQRWAQLSWDEALTLLHTKMRESLASEKKDNLAVICRSEQSISSHLWNRLGSKYPDRVSLTPVNLLRDEAIKSASQTTMGVADYPVYEVWDADFLLVFDTPLLSGWLTPTQAIRQYAEFRRGRPRLRGKMVYVGSHRSDEAANADLDIRVTPYTSAALALGLANVLIREGRYDSDFVSTFCTGFESFKKTVLRDFK
ncbi:MAG: hypothetical protein D6800_02725, partial [Candidatus Zixiibacteriota bacterium]